MSIDQAKKTVENIHSWEEARLYAKKRIADLKFVLRVFEKMIQEKKPWPGTRSHEPTQISDSTRFLRFTDQTVPCSVEQSGENRESPPRE
jgi:hypothetical protein